MKIVTEFPRKVREIENTWIALADGCRLAARIWLPEDAERSPVPALLEYLPYRKRDFTSVANSQMHGYFAGHGYASVRVDRRGSGDSDGLMFDEYLQQELTDGAEVIAWLAKQPWCTGRVGMFGNSWGGFNALQVAALRPPALKAIITSCSTDDRFADDMHYMGGCLLNDNLMWGSTAFSFMARPPDPVLVGERWREMWMQRLENSESLVATWMKHHRRDAYWKHGSVCEDFGAIQCPVYAVGGWADGYSNAIPRLLAGLKVPRKGLIGQWAHAWGFRAVPGPAMGMLQEAVRWWDHWLKDKNTGIMDEPMLRVWMQEPVPPKSFYAERPGRWVAEASWPSENIGSRRWHLNAGSLDGEAAAERTLTHASPVTIGEGSGECCPYGYQAEMPSDQREDDGNSLCFDSEPLKEGFEFLGAPMVTLDLAVDKPVAQICVRLNGVAPDGASTRLTYAVLNLTHRSSHEHPQAMVPGKRTRVTVELNDVAQAVPAGHRLRVAISTGYWPLMWPAPEPVMLTVFTGASTLDLPVRAPREEDRKLRPFDPSEAAAAEARVEKRPYQRNRRHSRDMITGEHVIEAVKDRGRTLISKIDLEYSGGGRERYVIRSGDPLSAKAVSLYSITHGRGPWQVAIETETTVTATKDAFLVTAKLEAFESGVRVFSKTWDDRIRRELI
jgi:putative CocE/NonD family hydrolase